MATIRDAGIAGECLHETLQHPATEIRLIQVDLSGDGASVNAIAPKSVYNWAPAPKQRGELADHLHWSKDIVFEGTPDCVDLGVKGW